VEKLGTHPSYCKRGAGRLPHETKDVRAEKMYATAHPAFRVGSCDSYELTGASVSSRIAPRKQQSNLIVVCAGCNPPASPPLQNLTAAYRTERSRGFSTFRHFQDTGKSEGLCIESQLSKSCPARRTHDACAPSSERRATRRLTRSCATAGLACSGDLGLDAARPISTG
jgi:hypothetical protein